MSNPVVIIGTLRPDGRVIAARGTLEEIPLRDILGRGDRKPLQYSAPQRFVFSGLAGGAIAAEARGED
jgi:uncharacterized membrane protein YjjP (DUF1212 family)